MDFLGGNILSLDFGLKLSLVGIGVFLLVGICFSIISANNPKDDENLNLIQSLWLFFYSCFLKPHEANSKGNQQDALESFYKAQAGAYDATRKGLLRGREDMLALAAAQLTLKSKRTNTNTTKKIWVDIGGGTGWNIEAMHQFVNVPTFFDSVYLVDFSPSLCEVARKRFARLGWTNVKIPDYYSVVDSLALLLASNGILGVVDFYVQSRVDVSFRNYTGGLIDRHVNFIGRTFWRAWFDIDRVALEPGRRDYLEYRFGTVINVNTRNYVLGAIPYYIWLGARKQPRSSSLSHEIVEKVNALVTESPYLCPTNHTGTLCRAVRKDIPEIRSKAFDAAIVNLSSNLPLPSFFYQNHHYRIYYDDQLKKHTQFNNEYIYAFTWEDTRVDERILRLKPNDVVLAITSAGDNILSYALQGPARIHAVDLNPTQNHLLELKVAAYQSLEYEDFWKIFGEGKHPDFRSLLITKMSPHLSSRAFQYWLSNHRIFTKTRGGLYDTGGSKHGIRIFRWITQVFGCRAAVKDLLAAKTLNEQREVWRNRVRPALLSHLVSKFVVSQESFLWTALGVPKNQLAILEADHAVSDAVCGLNPTAKNTRSHAIWQYMVNTLDPMVESTHIAADNPYYLVCLDGKFSRQCHPDYLSPKAHARLSRPDALDNLRIHTDEIDEVLARIGPGTLTVAVVMDSMDWFDPGSNTAESQITKLNRALKMGGRVMLRSAGLKPWYLKEFARLGFVTKCMGSREGGACIDRVNMYASCWICTKRENLAPPTPEIDPMGNVEISSLEI
ncbi:hypothetical protein FHL15_004080 [Xylaria flabelliformis]|uniref:Methyltransferase domain-containing protein n=1 Tax=Xylaria flabelliformis TaxID=2512241 RepID=A0A553I454_9PEZI|nr:hypothetical protein FHL15_004080 [Xylaria flabelliformis]